MKISFSNSLPLLIIYFFLIFNVNGQGQFYQKYFESNLTGDGQFGYAASSAGDVNNDGFEDIIIGAHVNNKAYIYFGGQPFDTKPDIILRKDDGGYFGKSVDSAGDINNDGYDDIIVGDPIKFKVYVYLGGINMDDVADYVIDGYNYDAFYFGKVVASAGDVNNDGFDDILIGSDGESYAGSAYLFLGGNEFDLDCDLILNGEGKENYFSSSISCAEDINKDGYDDFIIGAHGYNSMKGKAYVYFGNKDITNLNYIELLPSGDSRLFGTSVSSAGDLNGDGYDDLLVGLQISTKGAAYIYYGGESLSNVPTIIRNEEGDYNYFGIALSSIGDINNDGFDDICIGNPTYLSGIGKAYIYLGGETISNTPNFILNGQSINDNFSNCISKIGDVNNDGFDDFIIGSPNYYDQKGKVDIYLCGITTNNITTVEIFGEGIQNKFGNSAASLGDVNNDGFDDILIGAKNYDSNKGSAYLYYGGSYVDNIFDAIFVGEYTQDYFGSIISGVGDVNGDGYNDIFIGSPNYSGEKGKGYLYYGGSSVDNIADLVFTGNNFNDYFCSSASGVGDINGDGYDDLAICSNKYGNGIVYIYSGGNEMDNVAEIILLKEGHSDFGKLITCAGDINNDGYDDILISSFNDNSNKNEITVYFGKSDMENIANSSIEISDNEISKLTSLSTAGDLNNDGYDDIIIGVGGNLQSYGDAYIYFGGEIFDVNPDIHLINEVYNNSFGYSVSSLGDINNDAYDDLIVGAHGYEAYTGSAYIYFGGANMDDNPDLFLIGENRDDLFGLVVSQAGDLDNDGFADLLICAREYDENGMVYGYLGREISKIKEPHLSYPSSNTDNISKKIELKWNKSIDVDFFQVQISVDSEFSYSIIDKNIFFPDTSFNFDNLNKLTKYYWRVRQNKNTVFGPWSEIWNFTTLEGSIPDKLVLSQNYPNPFNSVTNFEYGIPSYCDVKFEIYNILGQKIITLPVGERNPGYHVFKWNAKNVASGIYIVRIFAKDKFQDKSYDSTIKSILIK